jgi:peptidoglycan/xylan/chitin deacetylase (PgdA/CDA1 family)
VLTLAVVAWQRRRALALTAEHNARRFAGAETVLDRGSRLPPATLGSPIRVAILRDPASDAYYDGRATMDSIVATWREALAAIGASAREVSPAVAVGMSDEQVLIVPASPCLGRDARHALDIASRRGIGLVVTWLSGVRDGGCRPVGYGLVAQLSAATRLDTLDASRPECYITFLRGGPLAMDIPPGARLELAVGNHVALRTPEREAYFSDYTLNPREVRGERLLDGAVVHTAVGSSRVVYWGFDLRNVAGRPWDRAIALRLTRNSVAWAAGIPLATVEPWPNGRTAAAVFAQDVEDEFANARYAVDSLRAAKVSGSYFLVSRLAQANADLTRAMAANGEIGSHTPRHRLLGGASREQQLAMLEESQRELTGLLGHAVAGLRPPEEQYDNTTLESWLQSGGRYVFATLNGRAASPEIMMVASRPLVMLGRVTNDDFIEVGRRGDTSVDSLASRFMVAFEKVHALGGLYLLSYHSQMLARPELVPALARVARYVAADSTTWVTTAGAVADWWLGRSTISVHARRAGSTRLVLDVRNEGTAAIQGLVTRVALPDYRAISADGGAQLLVSDRDDVIRLLLPPLAPGASSTTTIELASR